MGVFKLQSSQGVNPDIRFVGSAVHHVNPNSASNEVHIEFEMDSTKWIKVRLKDMNGKAIRILEKKINAGRCHFTWNIVDQENGSYVVVLQAYQVKMSRVLIMNECGIRSISVSSYTIIN